jgi:sigma-B regulation protein RsbU (phosphoserine phosphatase)
MSPTRDLGPLQSLLRPSTRLGKVFAYSLLPWLCLWPLAYVHGTVGDIASGLRAFLITVVIVTGLPLAFRYVRHKLLWRLSNRLVVNYLLIGLAPVVLIATLVLVIGYSLAGQFAIVAATSELDRSITYLSNENRNVAIHAVHEMDKGETLRNEGQSGNTPVLIDVYVDHKLSQQMGPQHEAVADESPAWVQGSFSGVVDDNHHIYLRAVDTVQMPGHVATVISSEPISETRLAKMGEGIGRVTFIGTAVPQDDKKHQVSDYDPDTTTGKANSRVDFNFSPSGAKVRTKNADGTTTEEDTALISGGKLPKPAGLYDINVTFLTLLPMRAWQDGTPLAAPLSVSSRPSALYHRLFAISNRFGNIIRIALISLAIMFAIIELLALFMAARLNRTITRSVAELYEATVRVDSGDFSHQIEVKSNDQLAELSKSFNRMTTSLQRLIEEQKEKERMQSELAIAQEVQNNLYPRGDVRVPSLELHGVCKPARTVSGDYYDFLLFGPNSLGLALGDISGKGISAALLMATLHSAVRAYRFAVEELEGVEFTSVPGLELAMRNSAQEAARFECGELFQSPARILTLLNRHLYRTTQPEKYATLWLGHYDGANRRLTYSNGGQLPPLVLRKNGDIARLDRGGMVVGLLDDQAYDEGSLVLETNDIVVAYSDGVTEPENDFGDFGEERLMEIVARHRHQPLETISQQVMLALDDWIGAQEQPDDITLVLARQA